MSTQPLNGGFGPELWQALRGIKEARVYPRGSALFQRGDKVEGIYLVESGEVRILLPRANDELQLLEVACSGAVLGLSECMAGQCHRVTADARDHTIVGFIPREKFSEFLHEHCEFCMQVVRLLSEDLHGLYHKFRRISAHPGRPRHRSLNEQLN